VTGALIAFGQTAALNAPMLASAAVSARRYGLDLRVRVGPLAALAVGCLAQIIYAANHQGTLPTFVMLVGLACATVCATSDIGTGYVFDVVTIPSLAIMLALAAANRGIEPCVLGIAACGGALGLLCIATLGRGIGLGDVKLACCIGAALGSRGALWCLWVAFVLGGICAIVLLLTGARRRGDSMCFAPFLAAGMTAISFHGAG
jgi:prepilin signal peptidase PulO-like enzyme (type II secretory pathway)